MPQETVKSGINYPWASFQGRPNYGCDFGVNIWGSHTGVSVNAADVTRDFDGMAAAGFEVARWFVFTDGRGGIRFDSAGLPASFADGFFEDMDAALEIAGARRMQLCLVLFDFLWMKGATLEGSSYAPNPEVLASAEGQARLFDNVIEPFLDRYGAFPALHSIDVINEPDWVTEGLEFHRPWWKRISLKDSPRPFTRRELRALVAGVAARVHARSKALATVGGAKVRNASEWDDPAYGLDFIQVHSYPDARHPHRDRSLAGCPCAELGVSRPVLIGEFPANGGHEEILAAARDGGYLGAWPWSFKGHDEN